MPVDVTLPSNSRGDLRVHPIPGALALGVDAFFTDRFGGVSAAPYDSLNLALHVGDDSDHVMENRRRVAHASNVPPESLITVRQVHGHIIVDVDRALDSTEADGIVSTDSERAVAVLVADCVPILLVDEATSRFGVVHAGWRGLADGVLDSIVGHFNEARTLHAFVGPCVSVGTYQVGPDVAEHFLGVPGALIADEGDRSRLDLRRVTTSQLRALGLLDQHVVVSHETTDGGTTFFSDRAKRPCGRFALVARRAS